MEEKVFLTLMAIWRAPSLNEMVPLSMPWRVRPECHVDCEASHWMFSFVLPVSELKLIETKPSSVPRSMPPAPAR